MEKSSSTVLGEHTFELLEVFFPSWGTGIYQFQRGDG